MFKNKSKKSNGYPCKHQFYYNYSGVYGDINHTGMFGFCSGSYYQCIKGH